jgi:multidrug efflux pump subunit AcrA (membrane-fusion protein)
MIHTAGTVREITPAVSAQTGTVQVKVTLSALPEGMLLGSVVSATAKVPGTSVIELPWAALTKNLSDPAVWRVDANGKAQLQTVKVGRYLTGKVIISEGLNGGEKVVTAGGQLLHPDVLVEIATPPAENSTGAQP